MTEATGDEVQTGEQLIGDVAADEIGAAGARRPVPPQPSQRAIEDFRGGHGAPLVRGRPLPDKWPMWRAIRTVGESVLDFALPPRCPGCGTIVAGTHRFCLTCWRGLDFLGEPECRRCGRPFERPMGEDAECAPCLADPRAYDGVAAAVAYGETASAIAVRLKHGGRQGLAETMARLLSRRVELGIDALLLPVPLHRWRLWRRGYNQAALIARALARLTGMPLEVDLLRRAKSTPLLRGLGPRERAKAVRGAFVVAAGGRTRLKGRTVLLVDDVYTTGATADACAAVLKRAGAAEVRLLCWARVVRPER